jgi:hypothetical protein
VWARFTPRFDLDFQPVPYEQPYKSALKALWAATFLHFNSGYTIGTTPVGKQLGYIRPGESVGGEVFPYCVSGGPSNGLSGLSIPYTFSKTLWLSYFSEMLDWGQSQTPTLKFFAPIDTAGSTPDTDYATQEANAAVVRFNGHGQRLVTCSPISERIEV